MLLVKRLSENAILPVRGSALAAGFDLASAEHKVVPAKGKALVKTDLAIATPHDCYARVAPRSGLAHKKFIDVGAGVIDADYRGNVGVILFNFGDEDFEVNPGDRIAQLILEKIHLLDVEEVADLPETERGAGGFGSTGVAGAAADNSAKRIRTTDETGASELCKGAQLLVFVKQLETTDLSDHIKFPESRSQLLSLALNEHQGMWAAYQAYQTTKDTDALGRTLALLV